MSTPKLKKSNSSSQSADRSQRSIKSFFSKAPAILSKPSPISKVVDASLTPAPSSSAPEQPSSPAERVAEAKSGKNKENGLPSPSTPADIGADGEREEGVDVAGSSPIRQVCVPKRVSVMGDAVVIRPSRGLFNETVG